MKPARSPAAFFALFALFAAPGCAPLPALEAGVCGNFVVDASEDCDGHAPAPSRCAAPEEQNACRFVCGGAGAQCPEGFGCGADHICRRAGGAFAHAGDLLAYTWPTAIEVGDFDVNGSADLVVLGNADAVGRRPARVLLSEGFSFTEGLLALPVKIGTPALGAGTGDDGLRDIAFTDQDGVALLRGYPDRSAAFSVFPSISLPVNTHVRLVFVDALPDVPGDEVVSLVDHRNGNVELMGISPGGVPISLTQLPLGEDALSGPAPIFTAQFDEALPCPQIVVAYHDVASISLFSPCRVGPSGVSWNAAGSLSTITLAPPALVDGSVFSADVDLDGHADIVAAAGGLTYVAFGQGDGTFVSAKVNGTPGEAAPFAMPEIGGGAPGRPLAVADLDADGLADFVVPEGILVSRPGGYELAFGNLGVFWAEAVVADFNGNGLPDIVATVDGAVDLDFLNNAGDGIFASATLPTDGPPRLLTAGDYDGDLLLDLAFAEQHGYGETIVDHVAFAFGSPFGPLSTTEGAGEIRDLGQIVAGRLVGPNGLDAMADLAIAFEDEAEATDGLAILQGKSSRGIFSTLPLRIGDSSLLPIALGFGHFGDDTPDIAALGADRGTGALSLFRIEAFAEGAPALPPASAPLDADFHPADPGGNITFRYGATMASADLDDDGTDEIVVVAPHGEMGRAALLVADYDNASGTFEAREARTFVATLSVDSSLHLVDIDGDGHEDAVVSTVDQDGGPADLVISWGNEAGELGAEGSFERLHPDGLGVRAVAFVPARTGKGHDLLVSTSTATYRLTTDAARHLSGLPIPNLPSARALAVADFDHDGVLDLALQADDNLDIFRNVPELE